MLEPLLRQAAIADNADRPERHVLHRDYETRGVLSLKAVGTHRYAAHPRTEVLCCAFALDDNPVQLWVPGDSVPREFKEAARNPAWLIAAHGDHFETQIERRIMAPRFDLPETPLDRHRCTMAAASAAGLPARLSTAADAIELANRKDSAGERLMHQTSKPRRARKDEDPAGTYWFDDSERLQRLGQYCCQDVETERELYRRLPPLSPAEHANWLLSCRINDRGFPVDRKLVEAARRIAEAAAPEIDSELAEITGGAVTTVNQVARLLQWLQARGYTMDRLDRKAIERHLERAEELKPVVRRVLELRLGGAQSAVKKIDALLSRAGDDDRVCGSFRFHGAATGRWSGEGFQPQNLKRPVVEDLDAAIAAVRTGVYEHVRELNPRPLSVVGDCSRAMIAAAPGHRFIGADFNAVESRVLASVSGEKWKVFYQRAAREHELAHS